MAAGLHIHKSRLFSQTGVSSCWNRFVFHWRETKATEHRDVCASTLWGSMSVMVWRWASASAHITSKKRNHMTENPRFSREVTDGDILTRPALQDNSSYRPDCKRWSERDTRDKRIICPSLHPCRKKASCTDDQSPVTAWVQSMTHHQSISHCLMITLKPSPSPLSPSNPSDSSDYDFRIYIRPKSRLISHLTLLQELPALQCFSFSSDPSRALQVLIYLSLSFWPFPATE